MFKRITAIALGVVCAAAAPAMAMAFQPPKVPVPGHVVRIVPMPHPEGPNRSHFDNGSGPSWHTVRSIQSPSPPSPPPSKYAYGR